jgi:hypothetical protein
VIIEASLASAEVSAGAVAKADQQFAASPLLQILPIVIYLISNK